MTKNDNSVIKIVADWMIDRLVDSKFDFCGFLTAENVPVLTW